MTSIKDYAASYCLTKGVTAGYARQYRILCNRLDWHMETLTTDQIDTYLTQALDKLRPVTVHRHRRMIQTLVREWQRGGQVNMCTRPIRRVQYHLPPVRAWSREEMGRLLAVAAQMTGGTRQCQYKVLLPTWIRVAFSTGLRRSDLLSIEHGQIRANKIAVCQSKTGHVHVATLSPAALASIAALPKRGPKIFGGLVSGVQIVRAIRRLVKQAGLCGSGKWLRRSSATYAEMQGVDAKRQLGHRTDGMKKFYLDEVLLSDHTAPLQDLEPVGDPKDLQGV
jgi:integrase